MLRSSGMRLLAVSTLAGAVALACNTYGPTDPYQTDLQALRAATQAFADVTVADAAGFNARLTGCMTDPTLGGMGYHIGNPGRINATVQLEQPEVLLYEPVAGSVPQLVAVEYVVPFAASATAPTLMGQTFVRNEVFGLWTLHVWLYKENPAGLFADWNPRVSCAAAPPEVDGQASMQH